MIADDHPLNRTLLSKMTERLGYSSDVVEDGSLAVHASQTKSYAAILMDCQMPVLNGYDATAAIRQREQGSDRHTPIIAVTAFAQPYDRERCLQCGMDDYLPKPVSLAELGRMLRRWVPLPAADNA